MNMQDKLDVLSFDAVIPSALLLNAQIEPSAIKLYAFVRGLTKARGYCYATNAYLAALMDCDQRNISRLLQSLSNEKFLKVETDKEGVNWNRRIFLSDGFKENFTKGQKCHPPLTKMSTPPDKNVLQIEDKQIEEKQCKEQCSSRAREKKKSGNPESVAFLREKGFEEGSADYLARKYAMAQLKAAALLLEEKRAFGKKIDNYQGLFRQILKEDRQCAIANAANFVANFETLGRIEKLYDTKRWDVNRDRVLVMQGKDIDFCMQPEAFERLLASYASQAEGMNDEL